MPSNYWKYKQLATFEGDTHTLLLMQPGFTWDMDAHEVYADISASEVVTANGYTKGTGLALTVAGGVATKDNTNDMGIIDLGDATITPNTGDISICGGIIWNVTKDILIDFKSANGTVTIKVGQPYVFQGIKVRNT